MPTVKRLTLNEYVIHGEVLPSHFSLAEAEVPETAGDGEVLAELMYYSVDPYMRGRMRPEKGYILEPFDIGQPITSLAIGRVLSSGISAYAAGDYIEGMLPWQEKFVVSGPGLKFTHKLDVSLVPKGAPLSVFLGPLGMVGRTAYCSLATIAKPKEGETAFVSGAAGAVGYLVGQLLKNVYGIRVVGSAGSADKVAFLKKVGYDVGWNYKTIATKDGLKQHAPDGIDIYFDNVGGETLEAALDHLNPHGRIVACGSISQYNAKPGEAYGVKNLVQIVTKRLLMQGFIVGDFPQELQAEAVRNMAAYLAEGKIIHEEHLVTGGVAVGGEAFCSMMKGANIGKAVVQVGEDPFRTA